MTYSVQVLERAFTILEKLSERSLTANQLGGALGLNRTTLFRILANLQEWGYIVRDDQGSYRLGFKLMQLGLRAVESDDLYTMSRPVLKDLAEQTLESAHISVRDGLEYVCVARHDSSRHVKLSVDIGRRMPLYAGAMGKALLAFSAPALLDEVLSGQRSALTGYTLVDPDRLAEEVRTIRNQGYAYSDSEVDQGARALAAPVRTSQGEVVAAVAIVAPAQRMGDEIFADLCGKVQEAGRRISEALGFSSPN